MVSNSNIASIPDVEFKPLYGVIGFPVKHSLSPRMHNYCFAALGIPGIYVHLEVAPRDLGAAVMGLKAMGAGGFNVTVPHKRAVIEYLDEVDDRAVSIGAVNTVTVKDGKLVGSNTDEPGFRYFLEREGIEVGDREVLLLGAGGSALAVGAALAGLGARINIANRTQAKAEELKKKLTDIDKTVDISGKIKCTRFEEEELRRCAAQADLVVNTTPIGMVPDVDDAPLQTAWLANGAVVIDLIYNPTATKLLAGAGKRGLKVYNGLEMLIHQGALAFALWTGTEPPVELMRRSLSGVF